MALALSRFKMLDLSRQLPGPFCSVRHRAMVAELVDRHGERRRTLGNPIELSATPSTLRTPPADFSEHTDDVLTTLGYSGTDRTGLRSRGVV